MLDKLLASPDQTVRQTIHQLDESAKKIVYIHRFRRIIGSVTDGDIRRYILNHGSLDEPVELAMNPNPIRLALKDKARAKALMEEKKIESLPLINEAGEVESIVFLHEWEEAKKKTQTTQGVPAVIMAGGRGTRLAPLTNVVPKPLVPVHDRPIVERIMDEMHEAGIQDFYLTVNYKASMIKAYFEETPKDYAIHYVKEDQPLGTGGSLGLLKDTIKEGCLIVSNCDILVLADYAKMIEHHRDQGARITIVGSMKHQVIPYGVVELDEAGYVKGLKEKPGFDYLASTGFYILDASLLKEVPTDRMYHLTELIESLLARGEKVSVYPVSEASWLDMGQFKEMELMVDRLRGESR